MGLYTQTLQSSFVLFKDRFKKFFNTHPIDTVQDGFEVLDDVLTPLGDFNSPYGLYPLEDKELLHSFNGNIEDIYFLIEDFDNHIVDLKQSVDTQIDEFKPEIEGMVNDLIHPIEEIVVSIEDRLTVLEDTNTFGTHNLTSSYISFTYESSTKSNTHRIQHNLGTFNLIGEPLVLNEENLWERTLAKIVYIDENTIDIILTEDCYIIITMTSVQYFVNHIFEGNGIEFDIIHNLNSFNLLYSILVFDEVTNKWENDICKFYYIDNNTIKVKLTTEQQIKVCLLRV